MPSVVVSPTAKKNLSRIITTHNLPQDTRARVRNRIQPLADLPLMGSELAGRWVGFRFILGPWAWMLIVYSLSYHLAVLRDAGVVSPRQDGRWVYYSLSPDLLDRLAETLGEVALRWREEGAGRPASPC